MRVRQSSWLTCGMCILPIVLYRCGFADDTAARLDALSSAPVYDLVEVFRLGGVEPAEPEMFDRAPLLLVDNAERLYVLHRSQGVVAVFGPTGTFSHWIRGGLGEGPGEFTSPVRMGLVGDTLWIRNLSPPRIVLFDGSGSHIATESVALPPPYPTMIGAQGLSGYLEGNRAWVEPDGPPLALSEGVDPVAVLEIGTRSTGGVHRDTILTWRSNRGRMRGLPFDPIPEPPFYSVAPDGSGLVLAEWNDEAPTRLLLRVVDANGEDRWRDELVVDPMLVGQSERDSIIDEARRQVRVLRENLLAHGLSPAGMPDVPSVAEAEADLYLPDARPPIRSIRAGIDGTIWLELSNDSQWLIVDPDSGALGTVTLPTAAILGQGSRNSVWYSEVDDDGVPWVVRARFESRESN